MKDERIEQAKNKIRSEMAIIILYAVAISFLVKTLVFNMDLQECITEYIILIFFPLYQLIRMHMMKVSIYSKRLNKQSIRNFLIAIAVIVFVFSVIIINSVKKSDLYNWQSSVVFISIFLVLFTSIYFIANKYNQIRAHRYENEFDGDK
ncbi:DUF6773 family protein [Desulfosporosinus youngiae]|uniref:Uncharacterized protein n=1 Tax=Desulfosporosinus youngiae DSM 17734 TaxID=768710 RepID=H5XSK7_9FIRM|nr:DUF6773 family protein [Desulfosporosinus youngiae]EHQ88107.1 hypothetical protein DesyoDRAFT_0935 [Desulfosporosinus youngiae DSM 17734]